MSPIRRGLFGRGQRSKGFLKAKTHGSPLDRRLRIEALEDRSLLSVGAVGGATPTTGHAHFVDQGQKWATGSDDNNVVAVGDLNGDGRVDVILAVGNSFRGMRDSLLCQIWLNDGTGRFVDSGERIDAPYSGCGMTLADLNGDGNLDIVSTYLESVLFGDGAGHFTASEERLGSDRKLLGDVDGDGDLDVLSGNSLWLNDGTGHFPAGSQSSGTSDSEPLALADLDNDGDLDAVRAPSHLTIDSDSTDFPYWRFGDRQLEVWLNDGLGHFTDSGQRLGTPGFDSHSVALGDLNGDGLLDAVVSESIPGATGGDTPATIWLQNGDHVFQNSGISLYSDNFVLRDVDADGDLDAIVSRSASIPYTPPPRIFLNDGQGNFAEGEAIADPMGAPSAFFVDLDGNGSLDAICNRVDYSTRPAHIDATVLLNLPDTEGPTVTVDRAANQSDRATTAPINFTVVFSEPVSDFSAEDVTLSGTAGATTAIVTACPAGYGVAGTVYNVAVSGMTRSGTVIVRIAADVAHDAAGNPNTASADLSNVVNYSIGPVIARTAVAEAGRAKNGKLESNESLRITWVATSRYAIASQTLTVDGKPVGRISGPFSGRYYSCTIGAWAAGQHTYEIKATDSKGTSTMATGTFNVANPVPPLIAKILVSEAGKSKNGTLDASDSLRITWAASSQHPIASQTVTVDGKTKISMSGPFRGLYYSCTIGKYAAGTHTYTIKSTDSKGVSSTKSGTFVVAAGLTSRAAQRAELLAAVMQEMGRTSKKGLGSADELTGAVLS
jgi:hypothetical protein